MYKGDDDRMCLNWGAGNIKKCRKRSVRKACGSLCFPDICDPECKDRSGKQKIKAGRDGGGKLKLNCKRIGEKGYCDAKSKEFKWLKVKHLCPMSCDSCKY